MWHKLDSTFEVPKAVAYINITSKAAYESPRAAAATHLAMKLLEDTLCETTYLADVAGLGYDVRPSCPSSLTCTDHACLNQLPRLSSTAMMVSSRCFWNFAGVA